MFNKKADQFLDNNKISEIMKNIFRTGKRMSQGCAMFRQSLEKKQMESKQDLRNTRHLLIMIKKINDVENNTLQNQDYRKYNRRKQQQ